MDKGELNKYLNRKTDNIIHFREAITSDDPQLLEILEDVNFKGDISLLYTRRPSPTASLVRDGESVKIIVGEKPDEHRLVAMFACAFNTVYINQRPETAGYICSFRIRKKYMSSIVFLPALFKSFFDEHQEVKYFYSSILASNYKARRLLEKARPGLPRIHFLGNFEVYALKTGGKKSVPRDYTFHRCTLDDIPQLYTFLSREGAKRPFFPVLTLHALKEGKHNPLYSDFYLLCNRSGVILTAGAVWNQQEYKQYIIQGYSRKYKLLFFFLNLLAFLGFPKIDKPGKVMNFHTLSFLTVKDGNLRFFELFLAKIREVTSQYSYFIAGFYQDDPLKRCVRKLPHFLYKSSIYLVHADFPIDYKKAIIAAGKVPYFECGRL